METYIDQHGREWIAPNCCSVGDYGGTGIVGRANIDYFQTRFSKYLYSVSMERIYRSADFWKAGRSVRIDIPDTFENAALLLLRGYHNSEEILVRSGVIPELDEIVNALEDYPAIDDEAVSEVEDKLEAAAVLDTWFIDDMLREAEKQGLIREETREELDDYANRLDGDTQWELYLYARDYTNAYVWFENFNAIFDTRKLAPIWTRRLIELYKSHLSTLNHETTGAQ